MVKLPLNITDMELHTALPSPNPNHSFFIFVNQSNLVRKKSK
jgi:hypothetical protein